MRRVVVLICLLVTSIVSYGQLDIKSTNSKSEQFYKDTWTTITWNGSAFMLNSSDPQTGITLSFTLGRGKSQALKTLNQIKNWVNSAENKSSITFEDNGRDITIYKNNSIELIITDGDAEFIRREYNRRISGAFLGMTQYSKREKTPHFSYIKVSALTSAIQSISGLSDPKYIGNGKEEQVTTDITRENPQYNVNDGDNILLESEYENKPIFRNFGFNNEVSLTAYQEYVGKTIVYSPCSPISGFESEINSDKLSEGVRYVITEIQPDRGILYPTTHLWITFCDVNTNKKIRIRAPASYSYQFPFFLIDDFEKYREVIVGTKFEDASIKGYYEITDIRFEKIEGSSRKSEIQYYVENKESGVKFVSQNPEEDIERQIEQDKKGEFVTELVRVEKPEGLEGDYGGVSIVTGEYSTEYFYEDELLSVFVSADGAKFRLRLTNQTDNTMRIAWQDAAYVDYSGETSRVLHSGVKFADKDNIIPSTAIIRGSTVNNEVAPSCNIKNGDERGNWVANSYYPQNPTKEVKKIFMMVPIHIKDDVYEYVFEFAVKFVSMYPDRLSD